MPYKEREAHAEDALLVIDAAETSLAYDRSTKVQLYAAAGIPAYRVVDCVAEPVEVYRRPGSEAFRDGSRVVGRGATVTLPAFPDVMRRLDEIFA